MICPHCHNAPVSRPRTLCWNCYYTPGVRTLYPSTSKYANRGLHAGRRNGKPQPPMEPTTAPPGPEKVPILAMRAAAGEDLWHPLDAPGEETPMQRIRRLKRAQKLPLFQLLTENQTCSNHSTPKPCAAPSTDSSEPKPKSKSSADSSKKPSS